MPIMSYNQAGEQVDITPEAYREKDWAKNVNSADDLFKQFENAQSLIGKSVQVPGDDAKDEDMAKFYTKIGAEKPEDYGLTMAETADDAAKAQAAELAKTFHDNGLSKKQAAKLLERFTGMSAALVKKMNDDKVAKDTQFDDLVKRTFGDKGDEAKGVARKLIDQFAPSELKDKMKDMPAEQLTVLAAVLKGVSDKYISQDDLRKLGGGAPSGGKTADGYRQEAMALMQTEAFTNMMHTDHAATQAKVTDLYKTYHSLLK